MKKLLSVLIIAALLCGFAASIATAEEVTTIIWGSTTSNMNKALVAAFEAANPKIKVEIFQTETATREQVLKTGISAGDPVDVGTYWGTRVNSFYNIGMCMDLTSHLDADNGAWRSVINEAMVASVTDKDGIVYAVPYSGVYHVYFYNKAMMAQYGFEIPKTWDDMTAMYKRLKEDDIFGFSTNSVSMQDAIYGHAYSVLEALGEGTAWKAANGDLSFVNTPEGDAIKTVIQQFVDWYKAGYWYPGDGGVNSSADDSNAGFAQGRCIANCNYTGALSTLAGACDFEIGVFFQPVPVEGMRSIQNMETDVAFIPVNIKPEHLDAALTFVKYLSSFEAQQIIANTYTIPAGVYKDLVIDGTLAEIVAYISSGNVIPGVNPCRTSSEMQTFIKQEVISAPSAGIRTIDATMAEMERVRLLHAK